MKRFSFQIILLKVAFVNLNVYILIYFVILVLIMSKEVPMTQSKFSH